jgi:hemerythrin
MDGWNAGLDVGDEEADASHRALYQATVAAVEAVARGEPTPVLVILEALQVDYGAHFAREEALMTESGYLELTAHRSAHVSMMGEFSKINAELAAKGLSPLFRLWFGSRFVDWLRFHIRGTDAQFYRYRRQWLEDQAKAAEAKLAAEAKAAPGAAAAKAGEGSAGKR